MIREDVGECLTEAFPKGWVLLAVRPNDTVVVMKRVDTEQDSDIISIVESGYKALSGAGGSTWKPYKKISRRIRDKKEDEEE